MIIPFKEMATRLKLLVVFCSDTKVLAVLFASTLVVGNLWCSLGNGYF